MLNYKDEVLQLLAELVAFKSVTPDDAGSLEYINNYVSKFGGTAQYLNRNQTRNILISIGSGKQIFAFAGHVDVVPPGDIDKWLNKDPYTLHLDGDQIYGRGVADMKGAIAAFLVALKKFATDADSTKYKILLLLTSDEEGNAADGTIVLRDYLLMNNIRLNYCLVGEPSCNALLGDTIKVGRRGSLSGELMIQGKQGHIAYPELCINPIHVTLPLLNNLASMKWDQGNEFFPPTSFQFANLNSGLGVSNVIPDTLKANFNFRYNNLHDADSLKQKVEQVFQAAQVNYTLDWKHSAEPFLTKQGTFVEVATTAINKICGLTPSLKTDGGTSDGRFLIAISDEIIELGLRNDSIHKINEATTNSDLQQLTLIYYTILCKMFNGA